MEITQHALARMQQRGIRPTDVDCLLRFGRSEYDHHGGEILYVDKQARRRISAFLGERSAERLGDVYAVVAIDGVVLTVGHRTHRIKHP